MVLSATGRVTALPLPQMIQSAAFDFSGAPPLVYDIGLRNKARTKTRVLFDVMILR